MADTLQEYLVGLGFKIDEASWKKYQAFVARATEATVGLGATAVETAAAIEASVAAVARQYESLYYVSQRTRQSASYIQATQYAFKQIGLSAEDATSSIEGVAAAMRLNPGLRALFGGATRPEDIVARLRNSGMPYFVAARMAGMAGIGERVFQHEWMFGEQERAAAEERRRRMQEAGVNADVAAERFTRFGRVLNRLEDDFSIMATRIALDWVDPVEHGVSSLTRAVEWFNKADKATNGFIGALTGLASAIGGSAILNGLFKKFFGIGIGSGGSVASGGLGLWRGGWVGLSTAALGAMKADDADPKHEIRSALRNFFGIEETEADKRAPNPWQKGGTSQRYLQGVDMLMKAGYSKEAAIGVMAGLKFESGGKLDPGAFNGAGGGRGAQGLPQLRGSRIDEASRYLGKPWATASFEEQMQYVIWSLKNSSDRGAQLTGQMLSTPGISSAAAAKSFIDVYERPGDNGRESMAAAGLADYLSRSVTQPAMQSGDKNVTVNHKTDIHVHGADARDSAEQVLEGQRRVYEDITRYTAGTIR